MNKSGNIFGTDFSPLKKKKGKNLIQSFSSRKTQMTLWTARIMQRVILLDVRTSTQEKEGLLKSPSADQWQTQQHEKGESSS